MDEVINLFNSNRVRYVVIGGQAVRLQGLPRFTMDWDIFIPGRDQDNIALINKLLAEELDIPLVSLGHMGENFLQTYQTRWGIIQFHLIVLGLPTFDEIEKRVVKICDETGITVNALSVEDLLTCKCAANRPQDQEDIAFLKMKLDKLS
jgi:hypothetical protein